jgi:hypothetical protein
MPLRRFQQRSCIGRRPGRFQVAMRWIPVGHGEPPVWVPPLVAPGP